MGYFIIVVGIELALALALALSPVLVFRADSLGGS